MPAPANWPKLARGNDYFSSRDIARGTWAVLLYATDPKLTLLARQVFVVDDFGNLAPVTDDWASPNFEFWASTFGTDVAADDWWCTSCDLARQDSADRDARRRTQDLLRPRPVTVEVVTEPEHPLCAASIVVGPDPRTDTPIYSVHVAQEDPLILSHAQLCALLLGAQQLVRACASRGSLQ